MTSPARSNTGAVAPRSAEHQQPQQNYHYNDQRHHQDQFDPSVLEELLYLSFIIQQL